MPFGKSGTKAFMCTYKLPFSSKLSQRTHLSMHVGYILHHSPFCRILFRMITHLCFNCCNYFVWQGTKHLSSELQLAQRKASVLADQFSVDHSGSATIFFKCYVFFDKSK